CKNKLDKYIPSEEWKEEIMKMFNDLKINDPERKVLLCNKISIYTIEVLRKIYEEFIYPRVRDGWRKPPFDINKLRNLFQELSPLEIILLTEGIIEPNENRIKEVAETLERLGEYSSMSLRDRIVNYMSKNLKTLDKGFLNELSMDELITLLNKYIMLRTDREEEDGFELLDDLLSYLDPSDIRKLLQITSKYIKEKREETIETSYEVLIGFIFIILNGKSSKNKSSDKIVKELFSLSNEELIRKYKKSLIDTIYEFYVEKNYSIDTLSRLLFGGYRSTGLHFLHLLTRYGHKDVPMIQRELIEKILTASDFDKSYKYLMIYKSYYKILEETLSNNRSFEEFIGKLKEIEPLTADNIDRYDEVLKDYIKRNYGINYDMSVYQIAKFLLELSDFQKENFIKMIKEVEKYDKENVLGHIDNLLHFAQLLGDIREKEFIEYINGLKEKSI
ncbi:MAG: hypothetical protein ACPLX8_02110, partial [Nanopusillaceae archaeon]